MINITLTDYWMNRDLKYRGELTQPLRDNAANTVQRVNAVLMRAAQSGVVLEASPVTGTLVSSGWRPAAVNAKTAGAAARSKHMTCQACDIYDPDGMIDDWAMEHLTVLEQAGLWLEHPSATKNWAHFQTVAPKSGKRVFYP